MIFFALSIILFIYVAWGSCVNYLQSWLGALRESPEGHPPPWTE